MMLVAMIGSEIDLNNFLQVCLGGFTITPPATFRLKTGTGPIHISGQHLVSEYLAPEYADVW